MGHIRTLFGLSLVIRAGFHMLVAVYAARDLNDLYNATSGTIKQIALKLTHINDVVKEVEVPLVFFIICGLALLILSFVYPWKDSHRSHLSMYAILHVLYVAMVVYVVYVRTIVDLTYLRDVYQVMAVPWLFPASLVLDVLTFISAIVPVGKTRGVESYSSIFPLYRDRVADTASSGGSR